MICGSHVVRSTSTAFLRSFVCSTEEETLDSGHLWPHLVKIMGQLIRNDAAFALVGTVATSVVDGLTSKEMGELMERARRIHFRLGHLLNRLLVKSLQARDADKQKS